MGLPFCVSGTGRISAQLRSGAQDWSVTQQTVAGCLDKSLEDLVLIQWHLVSAQECSGALRAWEGLACPRQAMQEETGRQTGISVASDRGRRKTQRTQGSEQAQSPRPPVWRTGRLERDRSGETEGPDAKWLVPLLRYGGRRGGWWAMRHLSSSTPRARPGSALRAEWHLDHLSWGQMALKSSTFVLTPKGRVQTGQSGG